MKKKNKTDDSDGFVYSTNPDFHLAQDEEITTPDPSAQDLRVWLEKNHRGGKIVTVIKNFQGQEDDLNSLAKTLKNKCGTGGTTKDGEIIIQGDHREKIVQILLQSGYKAKKAGS
jgi:translation initiation factor 1